MINLLCQGVGLAVRDHDHVGPPAFQILLSAILPTFSEHLEGLVKPSLHAGIIAEHIDLATLNIAPHPVSIISTRYRFTDREKVIFRFVDYWFVPLITTCNRDIDVCLIFINRCDIAQSCQWQEHIA